MLKRLIYRLFERRHYWRHAGFDELSELYTSMMLRSMGLSLIGIFVPIYLYKIGYELVVIFLFMAGLFAFRVLADVVSGYLVAHVGPKHIILNSYIFQIIALMLLLTLPTYHWPLWCIAMAWGVSISMFFVAYHVDFSKIMHTDHGGKELGIMTIIERIGAALGPVVGGIIATLYGPDYTIAAASVLFVLASIPLFLSPEPTHTHQKLMFRGLPFRKLKRDFASIFAMGFDNTVSVAVWPLYMGVVIFATNTYASIGLTISIGIIVAILTAKFIGQLIDKRHGRVLLRWSVVINSMLHLVRPFVGSMGGTVLVNAVNEASTTGYRLPYTKGMYDRADQLTGFRIAYIVIIEIFADFGKILAWLLVALLTLLVSATSAMQIIFVATSVVALVMIVERYPALSSRRFL